MGSYLRPSSLDAALAALRAGPRTLLAGGTDVYPARVGRPVDDDILDVSGLPELRAIVVDRRPRAGSRRSRPGRTSSGRTCRHASTA